MADDEKKEKSEWDFKLKDDGLKRPDKKIEPAPSLLRTKRQKSSPKLELESSAPENFGEGTLNLYKKLNNENDFEFTPAAPSDRAVAALIDFALVGLAALLIPQHVSAVAEFFLPLVDGGNDPQLALNQARIIARPFVGLVVYIVAVGIPLGRFGTTLGLKIKKLRVEHKEGGVIGLPKGLARQLIGLPLNVASVIGLLLPFFTAKKITLHDKMFETVCLAESAE